VLLKVARFKQPYRYLTASLGVTGVRLGGCGPVNVRVRVSSRGRPGRKTGSDPAGLPLRTCFGHRQRPQGPLLSRRPHLSPRERTLSPRERTLCPPEYLLAYSMCHRPRAEGSWWLLSVHPAAVSRLRGNAHRNHYPAAAWAVASLTLAGSANRDATRIASDPRCGRCATPGSRQPPSARESKLAISCCACTVGYGGMA